MTDRPQTPDDSTAAAADAAGAAGGLAVPASAAGEQPGSDPAAAGTAVPDPAPGPGAEPDLVPPPGTTAGAGPAAGREPPAAGLPGARLRTLARRLWERGSGADPEDQGAPPEAAGAGGVPGGVPAVPSPDEQVPRLLRQVAAWAWRLILVAILIYGAFRVTVELRLVVLPLIAAILLTALLQPLAARLRGYGMPGLLATWLTFLAAIVIIAGVITLTANRVSADYPQLAREVKRTVTEVQHSLAGPPFHLHGARLQNLLDQAGQFISQHKSMIAGTVVTGGKIFLEVLAGVVLMLFISFFLLKDGDRIYAWLISGLSREANRRMTNAGAAAWHVLTSYVRGTIVVAAIHAVFIGLALWLLGVPLVVPLIILVFLAAFIPLIGILVIGFLAILVTLATKGWLAAVILLAVFVVENQIEGHLLQPLVVGRAVRLHPLAIIIVLAIGGVIAGIPGAIVAVPLAAVITYAWPFLRHSGPEPEPGGPVSPPEG
ncbi:MAG TPA: AI-2E family transporter [Streptosporangiaceae bacterium]|jgi:predicted PurR-regulated permease PerM